MLSLIHSLIGIRKKLNTTLEVFHLVADALKSFHNKTYCISLFLDLRKAFDTVNVEMRVDKLNMCGIRGTAQYLRNS